jgi:hypothetical protein
MIGGSFFLSSSSDGGGGVVGGSGDVGSVVTAGGPTGGCPIPPVVSVGTGKSGGLGGIVGMGTTPGVTGATAGLGGAVAGNNGGFGGITLPVGRGAWAAA